MAIIGSLYTALSGLTAQQRVLDATAHNVANQTTDGYHRQRVDLTASAVVGGFNDAPSVRVVSGGVDIAGVSRSIDTVLSYRAVREQGLSSATSAAGTTMTKIEDLFGEPSDTGIATQLTALWSSWSDVATQPDSLAARTALLEQADSVATALRTAAGSLQTVKDDAIARVDGLATQVNEITTELAQLNLAITANPEAGNDLMDRRDLLVTSLGKLIGAVPRTTPTGTFEVLVGGRAIVSGRQSYDLAASAGVLQWAVDGRPVNATSGEAASLSATINEVVPRYLAKLDSVAAGLVQQVNAVHTTGYDLNGVTGRNFFDPAGVTAATIGLSADVKGQPANVAAGAPVPPANTAPGVLDGDLARQLAKLGEATNGPDETFRGLIDTLAVETRAASSAAIVQGQIADTAVAAEQSVGSVSLDEEMSQLVSAQRAYEASARVMTAIDDMLGVLLERTGLVGR